MKTHRKVSRLKRLEWAVMQSSGHYATDMMLVKLAWLSDSTGLVPMQIRVIADQLGLSASGVGTKIQRLKGLGLIEVEREGTEHKEHFYRLCLDATCNRSFPPPLADWRIRANRRQKADA